MFKTTAILILAQLCLGSVWAASSKAGLALVYSGPGACPEKCASSAASIARRAGLRVKYVGPEDISASLLAKADVWIQPGGDAIVVANAVNARKKDLLRDFISSGGGYLGFCAGAFFADSTVDDPETIPGLGIIPGTTHDYKTPEKATILPISWLGTQRFLYFEEGGWFDFKDAVDTLVLARYPTGEPAAISTRYGDGRVVVSGPHPEAPESWAEAHDLNDPDGPDFDLADDMLARALGE